jgi:dinuclear metal center YbgI/SA1388 family protein
MSTVQHLSEFLEEFAPTRLAAEWDNVGLLVGDPAQQVRRVMTCLTITPSSVEEAVRQQVDLIVTHHPFPFRPLKRLTTQTVTGRLLLRLTAAGIAVYSPHTAFDSAVEGINQRLAETIGVVEIRPLEEDGDGREGPGAGRWGTFPEPTRLAEVAMSLKQRLGISGLHMVGDPVQPIASAAVACGSGGRMLESARRVACDLLVLGETDFHTCLEALANGMALLLPGHYASERFAVEELAVVLQAQFPELDVWPSRDESDPLQWF